MDGKEGKEGREEKEGRERGSISSLVLVFSSCVVSLDG
jgi:hypothetical protein